MSVLTNAFTPQYGGGTGSVDQHRDSQRGQQLSRPAPRALASCGDGGFALRVHYGQRRERQRHHQRHPRPDRCSLFRARCCRRKRIFFSRGSGTARPRHRRSPRRWRREASLDTIAAGSVCCGSIIRSTTRTMLSFASTSTTLPTRIRTASLAEPVFRRVARTFHRRTYSGEFGRNCDTESSAGEQSAPAVSACLSDYRVRSGRLRHAVCGADLLGWDLHLGHIAKRAAA